jgi:DNA-binding transcriptional MerR regulator
MEIPYQAVADQVTGAFVDSLNQARLAELSRELERILTDENLALSNQKEAFMEALAQIEKVKDFLNNPEHILGSNLTKHGEIAEQIEIHIRNAYDLLKGNTPKATFEGVGRTAPEDYLINGIKVQSKFINGLNNNLDHVLKHMDKYGQFGRDGSYYQIPKDHYETIKQILEGKTPEGLSQKTIDKILKKVHEIESQTGKSFDDVVKPSISNYGDVQRGVADKTVQNHEDSIKNKNDEMEKKIKDDSDKARDQAHQNAKPNLQEGLKAGLIGAGISGGMNLLISIYKKHKEGKNIFTFNQEDWKDVGVDFGKGALKGGVTGVSIYGLTNFTSMTAPMASAFVSASFGVSKLVMDYKKGKISFDEFIEQGQITCLETGVVALGGAIGQALIPIPIIGTMIGSFAASTLMSLAKNYLGSESKKLEQRLNQLFNNALNKINQEYQKIVKSILSEYEQLGTITKMAFNYDCNAVFRFQSSKQLAFAYQVKEKNILKDLNEIDAFFLG